MGYSLLDSQLGWLQDGAHADLIRGGLRGIEKECLRVDTAGYLSARTHPARLGSTLTHPYLTTDYSEAQLEFVTPPYPTNWETFQFLCDSHCFVTQNLDGELLWAQSMPCISAPDRELPIACYGSSNLGQMKTIYRRGLGYRYGRAMQAISGVHYNFSLPTGLWEPFQEHLKSSENPGDFISSQYMGLVRNYRRIAWLFVYLFGASPALCKSFQVAGNGLLKELEPSTWYGPYSTSLRMSDIGYRNSTQAALQISANSLAEYTAALGSAVTTPNPDYEEIGVRVNGEYRQLNANILQIENEYYSSIRPKPATGSGGAPTVRLRESGVEYVEVRTLDINMLDPVGVNQSQLRFAEAAMIYCLLSESPPIDSAEQADLDAAELAVAREGRKPGLQLPAGGGSSSMVERGMEIVDGIGEIAALLDVADEGYVAAVDAQRAALQDPGLTPSAQILTELHDRGQSFSEFTLGVSKAHADYFRSLELSADKNELFTRAAERSLQRTGELEQSDESSFEDYLASYFDEI
jgi:glutamate--cysteine ligase